MKNAASRPGHRRPNKNEQAIRVSPNRLLVEDLTAFGYPRPAPLLAAGDHVFFDDTIPKPANRSLLIYLFSSPCGKLYLASVIPGCAPLGAGPESILTMVVMDSGLARFTRAPE